MVAGGDLKEMVITIPFLRNCIINMIADLERKFTSDGNTRRALVQPEAPELGFPLVSDEQDRPMHPLVETLVDDQIEASLTKEEEANTLPLLIGQLQTTKEVWGDQANTELLLIEDRAPARERCST